MKKIIFDFAKDNFFEAIGIDDKRTDELIDITQKVYQDKKLKLTAMRTYVEDGDWKVKHIKGEDF